MEIKATFLAERARRGSWSILACRADTGIVQVKALSDPQNLTSGATYTFSGQWSQHPIYGRQFHASEFWREKPHGRAGIVWLLTTAPGIGPVLAERIYDQFADQAVEALITSPDNVVAMVTGLSRSVATIASDHFTIDARVSHAEIELRDLLDGTRVPKRKVIDQAIKLWGGQAAEVLRHDPFLMADHIKGVGFRGADQLWHKLGNDPADIRRQWRCVAHSFTNEGTVWISTTQVSELLRRRIDSADAKPMEAIDAGVTAGILTTRDHTGQPWVALASNAEDEDRLSQIFVDAVHQPGKWPSINRPEFDDLTDHQRNALSNLRGRICHLGGSPGTGKTFCTARLVKAIVADYGPDSVAVCAFAAKAARRAAEVMQDAGVNVQCTTIHKTLGVQWRDEVQDGWGFVHHTRNPLPLKYLIVDESSMIPASLMRSLLSARGNAHVLLVGDINQLLPVGAGAPLRDFLTAGIPAAILEEIHRNAGQICSACDQVRRGMPFEVSRKCDLANGENLRQYPVANDAAMVSKIEGLIDTIGDSFHADRIWDVQVIVATNKLRKKINSRLQQVLNPHGVARGVTPFRRGDKIVNTRNVLAQDVNTGKNVPVANGEIGVVVEAAANKTTCQFDLPLRTVVFPRGGVSHGPDTGGIIDLGYCLTAHKMQGSEAPFVIVGISINRHSTRGICDKAWFYTAISRAHACFLVGKRSDIDAIVERDYRADRKTLLVEQIQELNQCGS